MLGVTKKKEKRNSLRSSDGNTSFVKNVTSRMSGFLPTTLTKWFSGADPSNEPSRSNGSVAAADVSDSSTEDEAPDSPVTVQPPSKRMRLNPPTHSLRFSPVESTSISNIEAMEPITPYSSTSQVTTKSEYTTSYIASRLTKKDSSSERDGTSSPPFKPQRNLSSGTQGSIMRKRKSLFDFPSRSDSAPSKVWGSASSSISQETNQKSLKPSFKPCLLGSPFYSGRTTYGGAASSYINQPNVMYLKPTVVKESPKNDNSISHSSMRVLDLIEQLSSPLSEARRIPAVQPSYSRESFLNRLKNMSPPGNRSLDKRNTTELNVPNIASILRLKKRSRLMDTTNAARQIIASHSSTIDVTPYITSQVPNASKTNEESKNYTSKMKSRLTRQRRGDDLEQIIPEQPNIPAATLQIDQSKLANFSFGIPLASTAATTATSIVLTQTTSTVTSTTFNNLIFPKSETAMSTVNNSPFHFSSPLKVTSPISVSGKVPSGFSFGSPERVVEQFKPVSMNEDKTDSKISKENTMQNNIIALAKPKGWQCADCWVNNKDDVDKCVCCNAKKPSKGTAEPPKTLNSEVITPGKPKDWQCDNCWVNNKDDVDKCVCCNAKKPSKGTAEPPKTLNSEVITPGKPKDWQCDNCWVNNKDDIEKCICCGGEKPLKKEDNAKCSVCKSADKKPSCDVCANCEKVKLNQNSLPIAKADGKWKCNDCWVSNDASVEKCLCCGAASSKKTAVAPVPSGGAGSSLSDEWKCNDCQIKNKANIDKCLACGGSKPGSKLVPSTNSISNAPNESFKKIISQQSNKWQCTQCLVSNDISKDRCACCDNARPGAEKSAEKEPFKFQFKANTTFKFGIDPKAQEASQSKPSEIKLTTDTKQNEEQSETNNNIVPKLPTFTFGVPAKKPEEEPVQAKVDPAPKLKFGFTTVSSTNVTVPTFGIPSSKPISTALESKETEKPQEVPKIDLLAPKVTEESKTQNASKISPCLFGIPPSTSQAKETSEPIKFGLPLGEDKKDSKLTITTFGIATTTTNSEVKPLFTFTNAVSKPATTSAAEPAPSTAPLSISTPFGAGLSTSTTTSAVAPTVISTTASFTLPAPSTFSFQKLATGPSTLSPFEKPGKTSTTTSLFQTKPEVAPVTTAPAAKLFSFGNSAPTLTSASGEKPKFNFTFGKAPETETSSMFKFGSTNNNGASANKFQLPTNNGLGTATNASPFVGGLGSTSTTLSGGTVLGGSALDSSGMATSNSLFGAAKETGSLWPAASTGSTAGGLFGSVEKPGGFTFGSTSFGAPQPSLFGAEAGGGGAALFGQAPAAPQSSLFGAAAPVPMFGASSAAAAPNFGAPGAFETPSLTPAPAPAFNFGSPQTSGVFGFGQGGPAAAAAAPGVYSFGGEGGGAGSPLQFNMGSAPAVAGRRVRKAARRIPPR